MEKVTIDLANCYGIKSLKKEFDFSKVSAYALYAPNGVMKSSLAQTFQDAVDGKPSTDRFFPKRVSVRKISDESGKEIGADHLFVVLPYSSVLGVSEKTCTLLIEPKLKKEFEELVKAAAAAQVDLLKAVKQQAKSKADFGVEISMAFTRRPDDLNTALTRIEREIPKDAKDAPYGDVLYDTIFNEKVAAALDSKGLKADVEEYVRRYNDLLSKSTFFKGGTFDYYNAGQIAKSLTDNGFFSAKHTVTLNAATGNKEVKSRKDLEAIISEEKETILSDPALRKKFEDISAQLNRNAELREFCRYLQGNAAILARMSDPDKFKEDVLKSYLFSVRDKYEDWLGKFDAAAKRRKEIEEEAAKTTTRWEVVIDIFNDRFVVPFKLEAKNKAQVVVGHDSIIDLGFTYIDGAESVPVEHDALMKSLSTGERKALYILNVIFEIETRRAANTETLFVVDDVADSFDYQNKYAIIQYLREISQDGLFKLLIMTHNFDFFRTLESRFVGYPNCFMAIKTAKGVEIHQALGIKNLFKYSLKKDFFNDDKKKIASIPFLRNLIENTVGDTDPNYVTLTAAVHWKPGETDKLTVAEIDSIFNGLCKTKGSSKDAGRLLCDVIESAAKACMSGAPGINIENKIVLAIGIRLSAERFVIDKLADPPFVAGIKSNQTHHLIKEFKGRNANAKDVIAVLDQVDIMTPENIHVNAFMYEPIVDMGDDQLRRLYDKVTSLK
jgi:hypothetical protein